MSYKSIFIGFTKVLDSPWKIETIKKCRLDGTEEEEIHDNVGEEDNGLHPPIVHVVHIPHWLRP